MKIIGIYGTSGSGKDTVADVIVNQNEYNRVKISFAPHNLYHLITEIDLRRVTGEMKELLRPQLIKMCQSLKQVFGKDIFIEIINREIKYFKEEKFTHFVIPDVRSKSECDFIKNNNGYLIYIEREGYDKDEVIESYQGSFDFVIKNNKDIRHLTEEVKNIMTIIDEEKN